MDNSRPVNRREFSTIAILTLACLVVLLAAPTAHGQFSRLKEKLYGTFVPDEMDTTALVSDSAGASDSTEAVVPVAVEDSLSQTPNEGIWREYDFIPGATVLFYDDFSTDSVGGFPSRLTPVMGNIEVAALGESHWTKLGSTAQLDLNLTSPLPSSFTLEMEAIVPAGDTLTLSFLTTDLAETLAAIDTSLIVSEEPSDSAAAADTTTTPDTTEAVDTAASDSAAPSGDTSGQPSEATTIPDSAPMDEALIEEIAEIVDNAIMIANTGDSVRQIIVRSATGGDIPGQPVVIADEAFMLRLASDPGRVRIYFDHIKVVDMPVPLAAAPSGLSFRSTVVDPEQPIMIGSLELAESSPTNLTVRFNSERRVITRGFMFRPDSDTLLPESSPMIRQVVDALDNDSTLVLVVDVHTAPTADTTNWSRIRARSLKSLFTDRYAVAPDRLIIRGSGSNQPIDGTDAPKAARNNERVVIARMAKGIRHQ